MPEFAESLDQLSSSDEDIKEILEYIRQAFPTYDQAMAAMGHRQIQGPHSGDTSQVRVRVEPVTTALVK